MNQSRIYNSMDTTAELITVAIEKSRNDKCEVVDEDSLAFSDGLSLQHCCWCVGSRVADLSDADMMPVAWLWCHSSVQRLLPFTFPWK